MRRLATVGYEGATVSDFLLTLENAAINLVIDVRELPLSRRRGFSKSALAENLAAVGINYIHLRDLGDPKAGREAARAGRLDQFRKIYLKHMNSAKAKTALQKVLEASKKNNVCLLCFERDPNDCHRKMITDALLRQTQISILHLGIRSEQKDDLGKFGGRARNSLGQSAPAA